MVWIFFFDSFLKVFFASSDYFREVTDDSLSNFKIDSTFYVLLAKPFEDSRGTFPEQFLHSVCYTFT